MRSLVSLALRLSLMLTAILATVTAAPDTGGHLSGVSIRIADPLQQALTSNYGSEEAQVLQQAISESVAWALKRAGLVADLQPHTEVLLSDARPSHPTRHQQSANPSLDAVRSISLGGATLSAVLRDAEGKELERVAMDRYASSLQEASASLDPWADARLTIDRFADQLVRAYRRHSH